MNTAKKYDVIVSDEAMNMLDQHMAFLANISPDAAFKATQEILDAIGSLDEYPGRFPVYENRFITDTQYRRMLCAKRYIVLYEITEYNVFVDYIVDCRQDYERIIK